MAIKDNRFVEYLISSRAELKKVAWPTRDEVIRFSIIVIAISLAVALYFGVVDYILSFIVEKIII